MPWPENTKDTLYNYGSFTLEEVFSLAENYFGADFDPSEFTITPECINVYGKNHDIYDSGDWYDFLVITKNS